MPPMAPSARWSSIRRSKSTLYLVTGKGLWRTTDFDAPRPSFSHPWPQFGRGVAVSALWIDAGAPERMLVAVRAPDKLAGLWCTTDDGASWTQALDDFDAGPIGVGAPRGDGTRTVYVHSCADSDKPRVGTWTGSGFAGGWTEPKAIPAAKGLGTSFTRLSGKSSGRYGSFCFFLPHPTDPETCVSYGHHYFWRSEDAGRSFVASNAGFVGQSYRAVAFDLSDWRCVDFGAADVGRVWTENGGDFFRISNVSGDRSSARGQWHRMDKVGKVPARSAAGIVRLPDHPALPPEARRRCIMTLGGLSSHFIFTQDAGSEKWNDFIEIDRSQGGGPTSRTFVDFDRQAPNYVYAGPNISSDGGTSWGMTAGGLKICGMSHQDGRILYARADENVVVKSTDRGVSWDRTPFYALKSRQRILQIDSQRMRFWLCPHDDSRGYSVGIDGDLVTIAGKPGSTRVTPIPIRGHMTFDPTYFDVANVAIDGNDPHLVYALVNTGGNEFVWRGTWDADFAGVTWEGITKNVPRIMDSSDLGVHPLTGEVLVMNHNGCFIHPPPPGYRERFAVPGSLWDLQPQPIPNGWREGL